MRRYTPKDTAAKEYYVEVPFEIDVDGPYFNVMDFYDRLREGSAHREREELRGFNVEGRRKASGQAAIQVVAQ